MHAIKHELQQASLPLVCFHLYLVTSLRFVQEAPHDIKLDESMMSINLDESRIDAAETDTTFSPADVIAEETTDAESASQSATVAEDDVDTDAGIDANNATADTTATTDTDAATSNTTLDQADSIAEHEVAKTPDPIPE